MAQGADASERLSHDDERAGESVSIENQKRILEDYARKNGFTNIRHFTDDGIRGTTFKRPGLDAMLDEIRAGNVVTVIIKNQSRIGRDVVEVGLLKRTFDEYHVRFIAAVVRRIFQSVLAGETIASIAKALRA